MITFSLKCVKNHLELQNVSHFSFKHLYIPTVRSKKKTVRFDFLISPKVIRVSPRYLWSIYTNIISFCWHNFHGRNFDTRRNFDDKPTIERFKNGWNMTLEAKKSDFLATSKVIRLISWKRIKWPIDTFPNL